MKPPVDSKGAAELAELIGAFSYYSPAKAKRLKVLLAQEVKRVIGEDEPRLHHDIDPGYDHEEEVDKETRNEFRAEMRRKAGLVMSKYYVEARKNVLLAEVEIEAESEEDAINQYVKLVHNGEVEVDDPSWYALSAGDCDVTRPTPQGVNQ